MRGVPLLFPFGLALFFALFGTVFFPNLRLLPFSPFLAILYHRKGLLSALWIAALCGLLIDLLSSELRLGVHALNYCLTSFFLYRQKRHFFDDKLLALSLFTLMISVVSTVLQLLLIAIFDKALPLSPKLLITDLVIMPLADGIYAFLWFSCPMMLFAYVKKVGWRTLLRKLQNSFRKETKQEYTTRE